MQHCFFCLFSFALFFLQLVIGVCQHFFLFYVQRAQSVIDIHHLHALGLNVFSQKAFAVVPLKMAYNCLLRQYCPSIITELRPFMNKWLNGSKWRCTYPILFLAFIFFLPHISPLHFALFLTCLTFSISHPQLFVAFLFFALTYSLSFLLFPKCS